MSVQEMIQAAQTLSANERAELVKALIDMMVESQPPRQKHSLREYRGRGAQVYDGTDAQVQVDELRREWDDRP